MSKAYVLINCELGSEEQVVTDLKTIECVKKIHAVFGVFDILADLECDRLEELRQMIVVKIRCIENIRSTRTLVGINGCF